MKNILFLLMLFYVPIAAQPERDSYAFDIVDYSSIAIVYSDYGPSPILFKELLPILEQKWDTTTYLNEYEGEIETRLIKGGTYFHKEYLEYNGIGNSILSDSSLLLLVDSFPLFVGMYVQDLKSKFPKSIKEARNLGRVDDPNLCSMVILFGSEVAGEFIIYDENLFILFDQMTQKVKVIGTNSF